jgi:hypothetical protein
VMWCTNAYKNEGIPANLLAWLGMTAPTIGAVIHVYFIIQDMKTWTWH